MSMDDLIWRQDVLARLEVNRPATDKDSDRQRARMAQWKADREAVMSVAAGLEIVRCKECKHYNAGFECLIEGYGIERDEDWFCADAERREE